MKILHTADWHLGKRLHGVALSEDHDLFFDWLDSFIQHEAIDVLLVAGDVFDLANPASDARKQYYSMLTRLNRLGCQVVITGGNHDSPQVLDAPREILDTLGITVVGGLPESFDSLVVPLKDKNGQVGAVVAAIPYLRDADLRLMSAGESYEDKTKAITQGIQGVFDRAAAACRARYPNLPTIAMGHLFAHGVTTSDSEREIQIGNLAGFDAGLFHDYFDYVALGHIHRPQQVGNKGKAFYSGSPVALSFSEKSDQKRALLIDTNDPALTTSVPIPKVRDLVRVKGTMEAISVALKNFEREDRPLATLVEVALEEPNYDPALPQQLEALIDGFNHPDALVVKHTLTFTEKVAGTAELFGSHQRIDELSPLEVFNKRMEREGLDEAQQMTLRTAFSTLLDEAYQQEGKPLN